MGTLDEYIQRTKEPNIKILISSFVTFEIIIQENVTVLNEI